MKTAMDLGEFVAEDASRQNDNISGITSEEDFESNQRCCSGEVHRE